MNIEHNLGQKRKIKSAFRKAPRTAIKEFGKALQATKFVLDKNNKKDDPVPYDTGQMLRSFDFNLDTGFKDMKLTYGPTVYYAKYVHEGTKPHTIRAKDAKVLSDGDTIFGKEVRHPGYEGNPFLKKLLNKSKNEITGVFDEALNNIAEELANDIEL